MQESRLRDTVIGCFCLLIFEYYSKAAWRLFFKVVHIDVESFVH